MRYGQEKEGKKTTNVKKNGNTIKAITTKAV